MPKVFKLSTHVVTTAGSPSGIAATASATAICAVKTCEKQNVSDMNHNFRQKVIILKKETHPQILP